MNKVRNWIANNREKAEDIACAIVCTAVSLLVGFVGDIGMCICGIGALIGIGANLFA